MAFLVRPILAWFLDGSNKYVPLPGPVGAGRSRVGRGCAQPPKATACLHLELGIGQELPCHGKKEQTDRMHQSVHAYTYHATSENLHRIDYVRTYVRA
jgi:hypothetical protein